MPVVQYLLAKHVAAAQLVCLSLRDKSVSPHVLRHTAAMELLQAGVDRSTIALWLRHESVAPTQIYLDANLTIKEQALAKTSPLPGTATRYHPETNSWSSAKPYSLHQTMLSRSTGLMVQRAAIANDV